MAGVCFARRCWHALHLLVADDANELAVPRRPPHGYVVVPSVAVEDREYPDCFSWRDEYSLEPRRVPGCACTFCQV